MPTANKFPQAWPAAPVPPPGNVSARPSNTSLKIPGEHDKVSSDLFAPALGAELGIRVRLVGPLGLELAGGLDLTFGSIDGSNTRLLLPFGRAAVQLSF